MDVYFRLNRLIHQNKSIEEIKAFIRENAISARRYRINVGLSASPSRFTNLSEAAEAVFSYYRFRSTTDNITFTNLAVCPCPLTDAALAGRWDVMKALFAVGFNPKQLYGSYLCTEFFMNWIYCSAIHLASHGGHVSVIRSLVEEYGVDINAEDTQGYTPLHHALMPKNLCSPDNLFPIVKYLVEAGAEMDKERQRMKPIHFAAVKGRLDICQYLLSKGAKVLNEANPSGYPLWYVANKDNDLCLHLLLQNANNLNPHEVDGYRETLLHVCAEHCHIESVKLLCSLGWNPEAQDDKGQTPLHRLINWRTGSQIELKILHYLVTEQNASLSVRDNFRYTPMENALSLWKASLSGFFYSVGYQEHLAVLKKLKYDTESLENLLSNPRPLQDLCCFTVRRIVGPRLHSAVKSLPLPDAVKDFVRLRHVPIPS